MFRMTAHTSAPSRFITKRKWFEVSNFGVLGVENTKSQTTVVAELASMRQYPKVCKHWFGLYYLGCMEGSERGYNN